MRFAYLMTAAAGLAVSVPAQAATVHVVASGVFDPDHSFTQHYSDYTIFPGPKFVIFDFRLLDPAPGATLYLGLSAYTDGSAIIRTATGFEETSHSESHVGTSITFREDLDDSNRVTIGYRSPNFHTNTCSVHSPIGEICATDVYWVRFNSGVSYGVSGLMGPARFSVTATAFAVPEPTTWAMMIGGFGLVGGAMRRRVRKAQAAAA